MSRKSTMPKSIPISCLQFNSSQYGTLMGEFFWNTWDLFCGVKSNFEYHTFNEVMFPCKSKTYYYRPRTEYDGRLCLQFFVSPQGREAWYFLCLRFAPLSCVLRPVRRQYGCQCRAPSMHCRVPSMHCRVPRGANVGCYCFLGPKKTICLANESFILFTYLFKSKTYLNFTKIQLIA